VFLVWLPVLLFFEVEEDTGKGQKQVRNRSETGQKHQKGSTCLASIHPSTSSLIIVTSNITITITTPTTTTAAAATTTTTLVLVLVLLALVLVNFTLTITNSVSRLAARAAFFEVEEDTVPGKVRNKSETSQKHQKGSTCLASNHLHSFFCRHRLEDKIRT